MKTTKILDSNEIVVLLDRLKGYVHTGRAGMIGIRNRCMGLIMLDAGLRVGEMVQLLQGDLFFEETPVQTLTVRPEIAKGKKERQIPLSMRLKRSIGDMWFEVWPRTTDWREHYAFYNSTPHCHITTRQIQRIIKFAAYAAFQKQVTPHTLRHTFGTRVLAASNIRVAQQLLGHASIQTTQIYTHPNSLDHRNAIAVISGEKGVDQ
ncbi:phage integrase family protein [Candidatus Pacearchaeota archaeon]|nr:phage integrase family protein [Candidatus Pacearchaeota archaeon]